jgi:hypothetical protein
MSEPNDPRPAVLRLQPSEAAVLAGASRLYAARLAAGEVNDASRQQILDQCVQDAIELARRVDRAVQSDDEMNSNARF